MFDFSQVADSLKAAVPSPSFLSFTLFEWEVICQALDYVHGLAVEADSGYDFPAVVVIESIQNKINSYEFH